MKVRRFEPTKRFATGDRILEAIERLRAEVRTMAKRVTVEDVREALVKVMDLHSWEAGTEVLSRFGASCVSELGVDEYGAVIHACHNYEPPPIPVIVVWTGAATGRDHGPSDLVTFETYSEFTSYREDKARRFALESVKEGHVVFGPFYDEDREEWVVQEVDKV